MIYAFFIAMYIIGIVIAYKMMEDWPQSKFEKAGFALIWPLMLVLRLIHLVHNQK